MADTTTPGGLTLPDFAGGADIRELINNFPLLETRLDALEARLDAAEAAQVALQARMDAVVGPYTYALWNQADKAADITLSGGDRIATAVATAFPAVRSTVGKSVGKWYWELTIGGNAAQACGVALVTETLNPANLGVDLSADIVYYGASGNKFKSNGAYGATFAPGDVIGVALDMDAGTLKMYKNGAVQAAGVALVTGLTGTYHAYWCGNGTAGCLVTANFGQHAFSYAIPAGHNAGLYV